MKIVVLTANKFGYEIIQKALEVGSASIKAIITLDEDATTVMYDSIPGKKWQALAKKHRIPLHYVKKINDEQELLDKLGPDIILMAGWRQILSKEILQKPRKGVVAFHPTLLPKGRGPAPIINSIMQGVKESGVTMFYAGEGLDDGDIIGQEIFMIEEDDYAGDVYEKVIAAGRALIEKYLPLIINNKNPRIKQDEEKATVFEKPSLRDNELDLENDTLEQNYRKIRALSKPYNGAYIKRSGKKDTEKIIIWKAELRKN
ncbi:hypothetical protein JW868_01590 [Candidatus Woesearchaeota archaeon]|nr:hypothetical protein [Candidatus Woesearchaeota archaeon]